MSTKNATKITVVRSSVSGRFVTPATAKRDPRETETEHYKKSTSKGPKAS
jgi:hypothetical protein